MARFLLYPIFRMHDVPLLRWLLSSIDAAKSARALMRALGLRRIGRSRPAA
jgi:hypothetical protein